MVKERKFYNRKHRRVSILVMLLLLINIGYALISSDLSINGTSRINNASWNIYWNNLGVTTGSVTGTKVTTPAYIKTGNLEVEYSITLSTPGEFYEFSVNAVNAGSIDAMINSFTNKAYLSDGVTETSIPSYLDYSVTYRDGKALSTKDLLPHNYTETYKVKVFYKKNINPNQLPSSENNLVFKFNVNYVQADNTAVERAEETYLFTTSNITCNINSLLPAGAGLYPSYTEAIERFNNDFFIRHQVEKNNIKKSYVGYIKNSTPYYIQGAINETRAQSKPVYEANKTTLISIFESSNCSVDLTSDSSTYTHCVSDGLNFYAYTNGYIEVYLGSSYCVIYTDGSSRCSG